MKTLVAFYSRTGTTKKVAEAISKELKCDIDEIIDTKNRNGFIGFMSAGWAAVRKKSTKIKEPSLNPKLYDLVIIGSPICAGRVTPAVRAYLNKYKDLKKVAFFCTMGGSGSNRAFKEMEKLSTKPVATLALTTKEVMKDNYKEKLKKFIRGIKN